MRFATSIALLAFLGVVPASAATAQASPLFESADCPWEGLELGPVVIAPEDEGYVCGYVTVPERHSDPDGPTIEIPVAVRPGTGGASTPLFLAQGGPGGSAFEVFSLLTSNSQTAAERDIVIFNQRGTSYATPDLSCTEAFDAAVEVLEADEETAEALYAELTEQCRERLVEGGVDLSAYNSVENAADIPLIAAALGYDQIDFYGVSYGTLLGLHLMRDHPEVLRSVILDAVVPTQLNFIPEVPASENRVWSEVFDHCSSDPVCSTEYPDLENRLFSLVERLDREPLTVDVVDADTGTSAEAELSGSTLLDLSFQIMYSPGNYAFIPRIISDLEDGDTTAIEFTWPLIAYDRTFSEGMYYSVICAEDADFSPDDADVDGVRPAFAEGAGDDLASLLMTCERWGVDLLGPAVDEPVTSDIPTLLLSGRFDPITPPSNAALAATTLSNSTHVVHPYGAHGVAFDDTCIDGIMGAFLADPDTPPGVSCVASIQPEETVPADAVTLALVGGFAMLESGFLLAVVVSGLAVAFMYTTLPVAIGIGIRQSSRSKKVPPPPPLGEPLPTAAPGPEEVEHPALIRWPAALGIAAGYGLAATVLAIGLGVALIDVAFARTSYLGAVALPPGVRWLLIVPWLLAVLAAVMVVIAVRRWAVKEWSVWGKLYYSLLAVAAVIGVVVAAGQGLFGI